MGILEKKVAPITGTGGGLGRVAAQAFAREGAKVVGCDIRSDSNNETVELVRRAGTYVELGANWALTPHHAVTVGAVHYAIGKRHPTGQRSRRQLLQRPVEKRLVTAGAFLLTRS